MTLIEMTHVGDGVVIVGRSGAVYKAERGDTIRLLPIDAEGLADHPEWVAAVPTIEDPDEDVLEGEEV